MSVNTSENVSPEEWSEPFFLLLVDERELFQITQ